MVAIRFATTGSDRHKLEMLRKTEAFSAGIRRRSLVARFVAGPYPMCPEPGSSKLPPARASPLYDDRGKLYAREHAVQVSEDKHLTSVSKFHT